MHRFSPNIVSRIVFDVYMQKKFLDGNSSGSLIPPRTLGVRLKRWIPIIASPYKNKLCKNDVVVHRKTREQQSQQIFSVKQKIYFCCCNHIGGRVVSTAWHADMKVVVTNCKELH